LTSKEIPASKVQRNGTNDATSTSSTKYIPIRLDQGDRRTFIGGSDARIIMGGDEAELIRLWREKRGEVELAVQLGAVTEDLIRRWYQRNTGLPSRMRKSAFSIPSTNGWRPGETDVMTLKAECTSPSEALQDRLAASLRAVTKLGGSIELVPPGSLPNDGKAIADERGT